MYGEISEWELSSHKREIQDLVSRLSDAKRQMSSRSYGYSSPTRDANQTLDKLERAVDRRIEELKRNQAKTSYSYSSSDSDMRSAMQELRRVLSKIDSGSNSSSSGLRDLEKAIEGIPRQVEWLADALEKSLRNHKEDSQGLKDGEVALVKLQQQIKDEELKREALQRQLTDAKREIAILTATACNAAGGSTDRSEELSRKIEKIMQQAAERENELKQKLESATKEADYLKSIAKMPEQKKPTSSTPSNENLLQQLHQAQAQGQKLKVSLDEESRKANFWQSTAYAMEAFYKKAVQEGHTATDLRQTTSNPMEEYANLWNSILEDNVVELHEVQSIKYWLLKHQMGFVESQALEACCDAILARGTVSTGDADMLYNFSLKFLKALGAKIGE